MLTIDKEVDGKDLVVIALKNYLKHSRILLKHLMSLLNPLTSHSRRKNDRWKKKFGNGGGAFKDIVTMPVQV